MHIQLNTDRNIQGGERLTAQVNAIVTDGVRRFAERITRVEVHLTDENSAAKGGAADIRCVLEARLSGLNPISARHDAANVEQAVTGATAKLETVLERTLGRRERVKGRAPFGGV